MKKSISTVFVIALSATIFSCTAMQSQQGQGTAVGTGVGAGVGAALGQVIGGDTESTLIGAGIGAALGGLAGNQIGRYMDNQQKDLQDAIAYTESASISRDQDVLRATFRGETFFEYDKSTLLPGAYAEVRRIADVLNKYPQTTIEVGGHTDSRGSEEYNQLLSERRANAVKNELINNGVMAQRIRAVGYGESRPISSDHAMNRRVEIVIVPIQQG